MSNMIANPEHRWLGSAAALSIQDAPEEGVLAPDSDGVMGLVTS